MSRERIGGLRMVWLEAFLLVAKTGSHTEAASAMGCDQSTISRYIAKLENWLHKALITDGVPVVLTRHGSDFVATAIQVIELLNNSRADLSAVRDRPPKPSGANIDVSRYLPER